MRDVWLISDTHFDHAKLLEPNFAYEGAPPLRPFSSVDHMHEEMVERWNGVVKPHDRVYHLGDVAIKRKGLSVLSRLNGKKRLYRGNHDIYALKDYTRYFEQVYGTGPLQKYGVVLSHIPLHPRCVSERWIGNIHGHLHEKSLDDPRYLCVSVEQTDYTPVHIDEALSRLRRAQGL